MNQPQVYMCFHIGKNKSSSHTLPSFFSFKCSFIEIYFHVGSFPVLFQVHGGEGSFFPFPLILRLKYYIFNKGRYLDLFTYAFHKELLFPKSERKRQIPYDITYMWNLKYDTNELTQETTASQIQKSDFWLPVGAESGRRNDWEFGISRCKLVYVEWISNKVLLLYPVINVMEWNVYIYMYNFAVQKKLTTL